MTTTFKFLMAAEEFHQLYNSYGTWCFDNMNNSDSFVYGYSPTSTPVIDSAMNDCTPVLYYTSYAQFVADMTGGEGGNAITFAYDYVMYDLEYWANSPDDEYNDPWTYIPLFCQLAHASGYRVIITPGRDLGTAPDSVNGEQEGQTLDAWYLDTTTGSALPPLAAYADIFVCQAQADESTNTTNWTNLVGGTQDLILTDSPAANPWCEVWGGVSTADGSTAAMEDCTNSTQGQACTGMLVNWTTAEVSDAYDYFVAIL